MLSYKYHEWSTGTFDTIKISSYFLLKMNKFSLVTGLNCPENLKSAILMLAEHLLLTADYYDIQLRRPYMFSAIDSRT